MLLRVDLGVGQLTGDKLLPGLVGLSDHRKRELLVLRLAVEGKRVFRAAGGDLVDAEPLVGSLGVHKQGVAGLEFSYSELAGENLLDIVNVCWQASVDGVGNPKTTHR